MVFFKCDELVSVLWGVVPILRIGYRIWGQNYVSLFQESKMSAGLQSRNLTLGLGLEFFIFFLLIVFMLV